MRRTLLLSTLALGLVVAPAWAGQDKPQGGRREGASQGPDLKERLGLTDEQAAKVMPLMQEFREKMQALREKSGGQPPTDEMREQFQKLREDRDAKLKEILTAEQFAKFQEMAAQFRGRQGQQNAPPSGERQGPPPGERRGGSPDNRQDPVAMMKERLGLTDEQVEKVTAVFQDFREKRRALMEKAGGQPPTEEMREEFRKLRDNRDAKIKAILTADQFAKYQEMMSQMGPERGGGRRGPGGPN